MSQFHRGPPKYVYDLPYSERRELCQILDQNDKWEELGGTYMKFDTLTIQSLRREILRGKSPTDELLTKWGHQNHTILELFVLLSKMQHYQAMLTIKPFVDSEYHRLIYEGEQNLSRLFKVSRPVLSPSCNSSNSTPMPGPSTQTDRAEQLNFSQITKPEVLNLNLSKTSNEMPDKLVPSIVKYEESERKILNVDYMANSCGGEREATQGSSHSNAQTVLMNREEPSPVSNGAAAQGRVSKLESLLRDKNMSEASCIVESVGTLPLITFKELEIATNGWDPASVLGKGGFGTVYRGTWKNTQVAVKRTRNPETDESHSVQMQQILGELKMLNSHRHDNVLPLYGYSVGGEDPCLIYQFMPNGSLEDRLLCRQASKPLSWFQRHNIATGTARGLQFLHTIGEKPLIHGDIKSANILLDSNFEPKIGDFGLAREGPYNHYTHMKVSRVHGTRPYLPDEFLRHKKFSTKVDTHSFGIVMFELATGLRAYDDQRQDKFLKDYIENCSETHLDGLVDKKCGPDEQQTFSNLIALGRCCVSKRPKDRPEMVLVLQELDRMAVKRDMMVRVQTMIRQNSLTPTSPYEMQVLHDHLSQQRKLSPTPSNPALFRAISPQLSRPDPGPMHAPVALHSSNPFLEPNGTANGEASPPRVVSPSTSNPFIAAPAIAVSPPSASRHTPPDECMYMSQFDNVLPLISELGIKDEKPQATPKTVEEAANIESGCIVDTSAKGKLLWILEEST